MRNVTPSRAINELDLEPIISSVHERRGWELTDLYELSDYYRRFLYITLKYVDALFVPCSDLDEFWCAHILHTKKYIRDCHSVFGNYLHHDPAYPHQLDYPQYRSYTISVLRNEFPGIVEFQLSRAKAVANGR